MSSEDKRVAPSQIGARRWAEAEEATQMILSQIHPTGASYRRRIQVINYVRSLIERVTGFQAFTYGSVPLKTYLPDGDVDMTAFVRGSLEEAVAHDIVSELQREEKNSSSEFVVKEVRLIRAEVKLVKCLVQGIVVDISFNQIGGLCAICFLEEVDRVIGKDHLFKCSILLIKAWCYYESRILGAHRGLISSYGLEILVLYIFQVFHSTLDGPLAVLYRFLDYFSTFDWKNCCVTLHGPIRLSSLPEFETEDTGDAMLLTEDFYRYCVETFSVPIRGVDMHTITFPQKHLNIVDPLREFNNLGRSVSEGNFYRIKSAFAYGARKLGQILMLSGDNIAVELRTFFANTLGRYGSGHVPDLQDSMRLSMPSLTHTVLRVESNPEDEEGVCIITALDADRNYQTAHGNQIGSTHLSGDAHGSAEGAENNAISRIQNLLIEHEPQDNGNTHEEPGVSQEGRVVYAPHLFFSTTPPANGQSNYGNSTVTQSEDHQNQASSVDFQRHVRSSDVHSIQNYVAPTNNGGSPKSSNSFLDLLGDLNTHFDCLQRGRWFLKFGTRMPPRSVPPPPPFYCQSLNFWDAVQCSSPRNGFINGSINSFVHGPDFYTINPMIVPSASYDLEDIPRPLGTGTYFADVNLAPRRYRPSAGNRRIRAPARPRRRNHQIFTST